MPQSVLQGKLDACGDFPARKASCLVLDISWSLREGLGLYSLHRSGKWTGMKIHLS